MVICIIVTVTLYIVCIVSPQRQEYIGEQIELNRKEEKKTNNISVAFVSLYWINKNTNGSNNNLWMWCVHDSVVCTLHKFRCVHCRVHNTRAYTRNKYILLALVLYNIYIYRKAHNIWKHRLFKLKKKRNSADLSEEKNIRIHKKLIFARITRVYCECWSNFSRDKQKWFVDG